MRGLADNFTLPLRGRVGPQVRGGVILCPSLTITPTRRFAATSPLKGEVETSQQPFSNMEIAP
jgi:hypothetical protein